ncbi:MAG: sigma-70 family RNA polymerase sigma factor [Bacteroidetes bacterium]|nr:sigma-70 family RNA polymerase sigma factor [Bacteroidota bacterium]MDA0874695.1 sigma-70 family RNA polymerase sigma factor [Bacteroidota bacterium]
MHPADEVLVARFVEHADQAAFRTLMDRHQERVFSYLRGMVKDREVANDLFQETFLRVISALNNDRGSYAQQGKFLGWVLRIARNAALDHLRSRRKWRDMGASEAEDETIWWERLPDDSASALEQVEVSEQVDVLRACIDQLPPEQREVVLLRHQSDLTFREIADLTDCSINTALGRMRYALINLRRLMEASRMADAPTVTN